MNQHSQHLDSSPPPLDEGYWASLLNEADNVHPLRDAPLTFRAATAPSTSKATAIEPTSIPAELITSGKSIAASSEDWAEMRRLLEEDGIIALTINAFNRGGLLADWRSLRGFIPASQLLDFPTTPNDVQRKNLLNRYIGETLMLRIIELDENANRLILSQRAAQARAGEREQMLYSLERGMIVSGIVTNLCDFGAFIDLGGLEGLIHISELSWGRVGHPNEILQRDQSVQTLILDINVAAGRIALSLKRMRPDPWATVQERYRVGEIIEGEITNVVEFGAFARVEEGLEGLIHVSELAEGHFLHPRNVVSEGQIVRARILQIDGQARRLGLSLRSANG